MSFFTALATHLAVLGDAVGGEVEAADLPRVLDGLDDETVVAILQAGSELVRAGERVRIAAAGAITARSGRDAGHGGLAQKRGHRSATSFVQEITGSTRNDAAQDVRLGEALRATAGLDRVGGDSVFEGGAAPGETDGGHVPSEIDGGTGCGTPASASGPVVAPSPWHGPLSRALLEGTLSRAQHDTILRNLGQPPTTADRAPASNGSADAITDDPAAPGTDADTTPSAADSMNTDTAAADAAFREVWEVAAEQLILEAAERTVEELGRSARAIRDLLDPEGAQRRFDEKFARRSFRTWIDGDGVRHGSIRFDDHGGAWVQSAFDAALRPRRGGPRFVDPDEAARADTLIHDPRTNDQLAYDLFLDILRTGTLAEPDQVFGTRQAGVRVVITQAALDAHLGGAPAVGVCEDDQTPLPAWLIAQHICTAGTITATLDPHGNPLDLGREQRLFSPRQRLTLALRDGGCRWKGCDRPASYCEAHHIDPHSEGGRTDIDRGILLCRFHHMNLHHHGWRITRHGTDDFVLHPPDGTAPIVLAPRLALRYTWTDLAPPPHRFRPAA